MKISYDLGKLLQPILLLTIGLRMLFECHFPLITSDYAVQTEAARTFLALGSFDLVEVKADDLATPVVNSLTLWPVGLPMALVALNTFTGDLIYSNVLFQCLAVLLFVTGIVALLKEIEISKKYRVLFLIFTAFAATPYLYSGSTDLLTAALFVWGCKFIVKVIVHRRGSSLASCFFIALLGFLAAALRLACIPNLVIFPLVFFVYALILRERKLFLKGVLVLFLSVGCTFLFYSIFPFSAARTSFLDNLLAGKIFISHLKWFDPFPLKSFFYLRPLEYRLPNQAEVLFIYRLSAVILSVFAVLLILWPVMDRLKIAFWLKELRSKAITPKDCLLVIFFVASAVICGFISLQSLTIPPEPKSFGPSWMPNFWTYVYSTRYFVYLMALLTVVFIVALERTSISKGKSHTLLRSVYVLSTAASMIYFFFLAYQFYSPTGNGAGSEWVNRKADISSYFFINENITDDPNTVSVIARHRDTHNMGLVTSFSKALATDDYKRIIAEDFKHSKPVQLFLLMPSALSDAEKRFLAFKEFRVLLAMDKEMLVQINLR